MVLSLSHHSLLIGRVWNFSGVGWSTSHRLEAMGVKTCGDLQEIPLGTLQKEFGPKNGLSLHQACRGQDDRTIKTEKERKSVSAEINYGIRFSKVCKNTDALVQLN